MVIGQYNSNETYNIDCIEGMKGLEDESVDLVVADPPYWKVVGEKWDYQWRTEEDYVKWSLEWFSEVSRVLRKGGTFYCFGYFFFAISNKRKSFFLKMFNTWQVFFYNFNKCK